MKKGIVIDEINKQSIKDLEDFQEVTKETEGNILIHTDKGYFVIEEEIVE